MEALRDQLQQLMQAEVPEAPLYGDRAIRIPNTICIGVPGLRNETQLMHMDLAGVCVSSGAACSSGKVMPSHVLKAMGASDPAATETLRFSLGRETTWEDVEFASQAWTQWRGSIWTVA